MTVATPTPSIAELAHPIEGGEKRASVSAWVTGLTVIGLYIAACLTPAIYVDDGVPTSDLDFKTGSPIGLILLLFGATGGNNGIPWSANVFLGLGLLALWMRRFPAAFALGSIASALGLTTLWVWGYGRVLVGYFLWQASLAALAAGAGWAIWRAPNVIAAIDDGRFPDTGIGRRR
jgi:hypothetical protein